MTTELRATTPAPAQVRDPEPKDAVQLVTGRCFLCNRPFRSGVGEPISGGEGVDLCISCGSIYVGGCGC